MKNIKETNKKFINVIVLICSSIFLSIVTISSYIVSAENINLILTITIILSILFFFIIFRLFEYYKKTLSFFIFKLSKSKLKDINNVLVMWVPSSIIAAISSLILFIKSNYVMWIYLTTSSSYKMRDPAAGNLKEPAAPSNTGNKFILILST